jgi:hypothetical protein
MPDPPHELSLIDRAAQLLSEASSLEELRSVRDLAEAARALARTARLGLELQNRAAEIKFRAELWAGAFIADLQLSEGDRRSKGRDAPLKLESLDVSRDQSKRWQLAALVPDDVFEHYVRTSNQLGMESNCCRASPDRSCAEAIVYTSEPKVHNLHQPRC